MKLKFLKSLNFSMLPVFKLRLALLILGAGAVLASFASASSNEPIRFADHGAQWTPEARNIYYTQDQGSQLIPLAWLAALHQPDGQAFAADALARYGYLPNPSAANKADLPVGFSLADSQQGPMVGMTCSACHERQINVSGVSYQIDGGPAFADFQSFIVDLDAAVLRVLASDAAFAPFAQSVLGQEAAKPEAAGTLHDAVALWSLRFHTIVSQSVPADKPWGPGRLDAIAMIYNRLNGLDLGPPPTFILPGNMAIGDAPARYPFLWNAGRQDHTQWAAGPPMAIKASRWRATWGRSWGSSPRFIPILNRRRRRSIMII